jgi:hypothetical protein
MAADRDNDNNDKTVVTINWNEVINQDTRSMDDADLGKVKGLYELFVVIEKGTINKEKLYIPKSLIEKYSTGVLYLRITEQEAKDTYTRESPPTEEEIKQIETITENRIMASRRGNIEIMEQGGAEEDEGKEEEQRLHPKSEEEEIIKKLKHAAGELKNILVSGAKVAKEKIEEGKDVAEEKIKEQQEAAEERKAEDDAKKISKMGDLALQFSSSFDDIVSEISSTRTYAEQEQIYRGFIRLIGLQRKLLVARKELASKLKESVHEPIDVNNNNNSTNKIKQPQLAQGKQKQLSNATELPMPQPRLPETINTPNTDIEEGKIKSKPRIKTAAKKESTVEGIPDGESLSTEIPSTEFSSTKKRDATAIDKRKLVKEKKRNGNKNR